MKPAGIFMMNLFIMFHIACGGERLSAKTVGEIKAPRGYAREDCRDNKYSSWLRSLPLKEENAIKRHDGSRVPDNYYNVFAVVDMPLLFTGNIEQCADWGFRFWSEYHRDSGMLNRLYLLDYSGNKRYYSKSGMNYNGFLKYSMNYANSHSIKSGCDKVFSSDIRGGDMFVQNKTGGIGHVSIVMDVCGNPAGEKLYLIGYSFMPAQQFHIERADDRYGREGWFTLEGYGKYLEDNLNFGPPVYRRFR